MATSRSPQTSPAAVTLPSQTGPSSTTSTSTSATSTSTATQTGTSTTANPTTTSSTSTSTSSSAPVASTSTTSSSSSSTSATTSITSTSSSTTATPPSITASTASILTSTAPGGGITTVTSTVPVVVSPSTTSTTTQNNATSSSFFKNKGAVAGVFSVVGLIGLALIIALVTNAVRRRRAKQFDRDVAQAAAEAAAVSRQHYDDYPSPSSGGGGYGYSDNSHGSYAQPPLAPDTYGMSDMGQMGQFNPYAAGAAALHPPSGMDLRGRSESQSVPGVAGVGAGIRREPSMNAPYHAFAGPPAQNNGSMRYPRSGNDVLEAIGLGASGAASAGATHGGAYVSRRPSEHTQVTHHSGPTMSQGYHSPDSYPQPTQYQSYGRSNTMGPGADAYGGYDTGDMSAGSAYPNPHGAPSPTRSPPLPQAEHVQHEFSDEGELLGRRDSDPRASYQDDSDYGQSNRVLRVTNE